MLRLFLAIPIPNDIKNKILRWQIGSEKHNIPWIPEKNLHVTLLFLGNVKKENLEELKNSLQKVCAQAESFVLDFEKFCIKNHSMIWGQFQENVPFSALFSACQKAVSPFLETPLQNYKKQIPHVTLARYKSPPPLQFPVPLPSFHVKTIELWQSELAHPHAKYTSQASFSFRSAVLE